MEAESGLAGKTVVFMFGTVFLLGEGELGHKLLEPGVPIAQVQSSQTLPEQGGGFGEQGQTGGASWVPQCHSSEPKTLVLKSIDCICLRLGPGNTRSMEMNLDPLFGRWF